MGSTRVIDSFLFDSLVFCQENPTFSIRALSRDSGWGPGDRSPFSGCQALLFERTDSIVMSCQELLLYTIVLELDAISFGVISGSGRVVVVLLPGE